MKLGSAATTIAEKHLSFMKKKTSRIISGQKYNLVIYGSIARENISRRNLPIHIHVKQLEAAGSYIHIIKKPCLVN